MKNISRRISKRAISGAAIIGGMPLAVLRGAFVTEYKPENIETSPIFSVPDAPRLVMGQEISILSWNLQYCAGRKHRFFYDGGGVVNGNPDEVAKTMSDIISTIKSLNPDISLLQEVDRNAKRTQHIDQLREIVDSMGRVNWSATPYHRSPFVPSPLSNPLGRVDLNLAVISKYQMTDALRRQLALLNEPRLRQIFNLKRAILDASIPIEGHAKPLIVGVTHLSAFSFGDGTLQKQVDQLDEWMASHPPDQPWILAGDLNLLPPGDTPQRLEKNSDLYADSENPISTLIPKYNTAFIDQLDAANRTYLPFGNERPDRKIDYLFFGGPLKRIESKVLIENSDLSDHLPVWVKLKLVPTL